MRTVAVRAVAALILAGATFVAGAARPPAGGGGGVAAAAEEGELLKAVQAVLDARVAAVRSGDRAAWMATVDPNAPAAFGEAQARQYDGLRSLPLSAFDLRARLDDTGDLAAGIVNTYGAPIFLPETRQLHRFTGYDDRDAVDSLWLTFVERDGRWYVGGDRDLEPLGLDTVRGLWDLGPVTTLPTEHFLVLHHPEQRERAAALASIAEDAAAALRERWEKPWSNRIPLVLPGSVDELEILLQSTIDLDKFVAFVAYEDVRDDGWAATAPRIYIQDRNLGRYPRPFQVETLVHELAHAAAAPLAGPFVPAWVHEATADWVAKDRPTGERKPGGSDGHLPRDFEFTTGSQQSIIRSYEESRSAASFLAARRGLGAPADLLAALGEARVVPGNPDHHVDQALRRVAGQGFADFEAGWARR